MDPDRCCLMGLISEESHRRGLRSLESPDRRIRQESHRLQTFGVGGAGRDTRLPSRDWILWLERTSLHLGRKQADPIG